MLHDIVNSIRIALSKGQKSVNGLRVSKYALAYLKKLANLGYVSKLEVFSNFKNFKRVKLEFSDSLLDIKYHRVQRFIKHSQIPIQLRYLDRGKGHLIISTNQGIMSGVQALKKQLGGVNLGFVY